MQKLKFGTDGWRAIIAKDYTVENVKRVAYATALHLNDNYTDPSIVLGFDCRFGGQMFAETVIEVMASNGIKVLFDKNFSSTPMVSLAAKKLNTSMGVVITASHNPPSYNGYKLKGGFGGPSSQDTIKDVEARIPDHAVELELKGMENIEKSGFLEYVDLESLYYDHICAHFDIEAIKSADMEIAYDAMYGAGQQIFRRLFPDAHILHGDFNPSFMGQAPEPLHKNLQELSKFIASNDRIQFGLATDGDADRIGAYDEKGQFVDAHHIILVLIHILFKYKELTGDVVVAFSVSNKVKKMCEAYGLNIEVTKIGFKYICEVMMNKDVLVGGEESGGIAVKGHIPERDGIWDGLLILEHLAKTGKSMSDLIHEVYEIVGSFSYNRNDLHISETLKHDIMKNCEDGKYTHFGSYEISSCEDIDGYKYNLKSGETLMIRPSGTEPVLRVYGEASSPDEVEKLLKNAKETLLSN